MPGSSLEQLPVLPPPLFERVLDKETAQGLIAAGALRSYEVATHLRGLPAVRVLVHEGQGGTLLGQRVPDDPALLVGAIGCVAVRAPGAPEGSRLLRVSVMVSTTDAQAALERATSAPRVLPRPAGPPRTDGVAPTLGSSGAGGIRARLAVTTEDHLARAACARREAEVAFMRGQSPRAALVEEARIELDAAARAIGEGRPYGALDAVHGLRLSRALIDRPELSEQLDRILGALDPGTFEPGERGRLLLARAVLVHYRRGDMSAAAADLERAILDLEDEHPFAHGEALVHLGRVYDNQIRAAEKSDPARAHALTAQAEAAYDRAAQILEARPGDAARRAEVHLQLNRAFHAELLGDLAGANEALACGRRIRVLYPEGAVQLAYNQGRIFAHHGQPARALAALEYAAQRATDGLSAGIALQNLGVAHAKLGDRASARHAFDRALGDDGFRPDVATHAAGREFTQKLSADL
jgi:tetratricopeptide (TPR) repeat protein